MNFSRVLGPSEWEMSEGLTKEKVGSSFDPGGANIRRSGAGRIQEKKQQTLKPAR